jgi:cytochrome P450
MSETQERQKPRKLPTDARAEGCPFAPTPELYEMQKEDELRRVKVPIPVLGDFEAFAATRYEDVKAVLGDDRLRMGFAVDPDAPRTMLNQPGNLLNYNGTAHTRLRRMLSGYFTVKRVRTLRPMIEKVVEARLDALEEAGPGADLVQVFSTPIPTQVICELMGVPYADRADFQRRAKIGIDVNTTRERQIENLIEMDIHMSALIESHRKNLGDNLLSNLIRDFGDELTPDELVGIGDMLLIAGHETTASMISASTALLLENPEQLAVVRDDPEAIDRAIEELVRYVAPATIMPRQATEDLTVRDQTIKQGERVVVSLLVANRDLAKPDENLDELDVRRAPQAHVAFGFGAHQCLGQQLARMEMRVALPALFNRFPTLKVTPGEEIDYRTTALVFGVNKLPVSW